MRIRSASFTHRGRRRARNEDAVCESPEAGVFAIADGMGGMSDGQAAGEAAISAVREEALYSKTSSSISRRAVCRLFRVANERVRAVPDDGRSVSSPQAGSTLVVLRLCRGRFLVGNVGDCRAYYLRDRSLRQITRDHTVVGDLLARGRISEEESRRHPRRGVLTRYLGSDPGPRIDFFEGETLEGDLFLLASDGLYEYADDELIEKAADSCVSPDDLVQELGQLALDCGGCDNISIVAVRIGSGSARRRNHGAADGGMPTVPLG